MFEIWPYWYKSQFCTFQPNRTNSFTPDLKAERLEDVEIFFNNLLQQGGFHAPNECKAKHHVAIIIPYMNHENVMPIFLKNMHSFLIKQPIEYGIFIIEQIPDQQFNRGTLFNIGYAEAMKIKPWDCFVFHDINLIPTNFQNSYTCSKENPMHMSVAIDKLFYRYFFFSVIKHI